MYSIKLTWIKVHRMISLDFFLEHWRTLKYETSPNVKCIHQLMKVPNTPYLKNKYGFRNLLNVWLFYDFFILLIPQKILISMPTVRIRVLCGCMSTLQRVSHYLLIVHCSATLTDIKDLWSSSYGEVGCSVHQSGTTIVATQNPTDDNAMERSNDYHCRKVLALSWKNL